MFSVRNNSIYIALNSQALGPVVWAIYVIGPKTPCVSIYVLYSIAIEILYTKRLRCRIELKWGKTLLLLAILIGKPWSHYKSLYNKLELIGIQVN
jgi:hypothetical protein